MAECWNDWVQRHGAAALLFARQYTHSSADAQDAVQEGFIRFWRQRQRARDPIALLFASVRSAALDLHRRRRRRELRERKAVEERPMLVSPETDMGARREAVEQALRKLPSEQREVVVLKIWAGLTLSQIAAALSESANTVASRYRYGLEKLAALLPPEVWHER